MPTERTEAELEVIRVLLCREFRRLRKQLGVTQRELADWMGFNTASSFSLIENELPGASIQMVLRALVVGGASRERIARALLKDPTVKDP